MADNKSTNNTGSKIELLEREDSADTILFDMVDTKTTELKSGATEIVKPLPEFKTNYSSHKLNKVYNQMDLDTFVEEQTFIEKKHHRQENVAEVHAPTKSHKNYSFDTVLDAQDDVSPELEIKTYSAPKQKKKFNFSFKSKTFVAIVAVVAVLFTGLLVYNGVSINQASERLAAQQAELEIQQSGLDAIIADYTTQTGGSAVDQAATDLGLQPNQNVNPKKINIKPPREEVKYNVITNFFDKLCNMIASIFGR